MQNIEANTPITECIILAGGLGMRLRSAVPDLPKCLAPVAGRPFLAYVIDYFKDQGINRFVLSLGYKHEVIESFIQSSYPDEDIEFCVEKELLGTGGAIQLACSKVQGKHVVATNGDTLFRVDTGKLKTTHFRQAAHCTLALKPMQQVDRYGMVELNADGSVSNFLEKKYYEQATINGGVYLLDKEQFLQHHFPAKFSFEKDYLQQYSADRKFYGVVQDGYFIDIGIPEDFEKANRDLAGQ